LIVPEGCDNAKDVIAVICGLWGLELPQLLLAIDGGQDTLEGMFENVIDKQVWGQPGATEDVDFAANPQQRQAAVARFDDAICTVYAGIASACAECNAWVWGWDGGYGGGGNLNDVWGNCHNQGWTMFGHGVSRSADKDKVVFLCNKGLENMFGAESFKQLARPLNEKIKKAVFYPSISHKFIKEGKCIPSCQFGKDMPKKFQCMQPWFTHCILYAGDGQKYPHPQVYEELRNFSPVARLVVGGVHPILTRIMMHCAADGPIICLKNSGGAADVISYALEQRKRDGDQAEGVKIEGGYSQSCDALLTEEEKQAGYGYKLDDVNDPPFFLPSSANEANLIVVDCKQDSVVNVVDKLLRVVSTADDVETRKLGAKSLELERLKEAWKMVVTYKYNASIAYRQAVFFTYAIIALAVFTTAASIGGAIGGDISEEPGNSNVTTWLKQNLRVETGNNSWMSELFSRHSFQFTVALLPLLSGFFMSANARFTPMQRYVQLSNASNKTRTEIYRYRARVAEYGSKLALEFKPQEYVKSLPNVHSMLSARSYYSVAASSAASDVSLSPPSEPSSKEPLLAKDSRGSEQSDDRSGPILETRRAAFNRQLTGIQTELAQGFVRQSTLHDPPESTIAGERMLLQGNWGHQRAADHHDIFHGAFVPGELQSIASERMSDDGFAAVAGDDYIHVRTMPAIAQLENLSRRHERAVFALQILVFLGTMLNAVVAVFKMDILMPLIVALIGSVSAILDFHRFEQRLQGVNGALSSLRNLIIDWESLTMVEKRQQWALEHLVEVTEQAVDSDLVWASKGTSRGRIMGGTTDNKEKDKDKDQGRGNQKDEGGKGGSAE